MTRCPPLDILGWGTALPPHRIAQGEAATLAGTLALGEAARNGHARLLAALYARAGVRRRSSVLLNGPECAARQNFFPAPRDEDDRGPTTRQRMERYGVEAPPLAAAAAREALAQAGVAAHSITHLVTVSCSGFGAPGVDLALVAMLGLPATVERTHIGFMGCHGALNGLRVAAALGAARPGARILLSAVELCSLHFQYHAGAEQIVANSLFADGAAALVAAPSSPTPSRREAAWRLTSSGAYIFAETAHAMSWSIGDHGFRMTLDARVPGMIRAGLRPWLESWLAEANLKLADVALWAIHPGGPRILQASETALDLPRKATAISREVLAEHGNMSSPTVLFILKRLWEETEGAGPCVALAFGPGLAAEATLFERAE